MSSHGCEYLQKAVRNEGQKPLDKLVNKKLICRANQHKFRRLEQSDGAVARGVGIEQELNIDSTL